MATDDVQDILQSDSALSQSVGDVQAYFEGFEHVQEVFSSSALSTDQDVERHWRRRNAEIR